MTCKELICDICEEQKSIYKNVCPQCYISGFSYAKFVNKIAPYEVYKNIACLYSSNDIADLHFLKKIIELKRLLISIIGETINFDSKIETRCKCGHILKRIISMKQTEHNLQCPK